MFFRARATNTQLGQEENSAFTYLEVYGEDGADVPPEIIVAPKDTQIVKGTQVTELQVDDCSDTEKNVLTKSCLSLN